MLMSSRSLQRKEDLDDDDGLSPFDLLAKVICTIASGKIKLLQETQENSDLPLKKRRSYFDFLNTTPSPSPTPSNTNTNPNSRPKEGNEIVIVREKGQILESSSGQVWSGSHEEEEKSGNQQEEEHQPLLPNKKRSHSNIEEIPDLLEECCPHPKKPRSPTKATSIILFGKELTTATDIPASSSASGTALDYVHEAQTVTDDKDNLKKKYIDVDGGEDCEGAAPPNKKKKKVKFIFNNLNTTNKVVNKGKNKVKFASGMTAPDLPEEFKSLILGEMNGTKLQMLAQKSLYNTDINKDQGRLSLPRMQTESKNFLKPNEKEELDKTSLLTVPLIGPKLEPDKVSLGLWTMSSKSQKTYVLKSTWFAIVEKHGLGVGDVVQVWSFRATNPKYKIKDGDHDHLTRNDDQLHLALVLVERGYRLLKEGGSKEGGTSSSGVSSSMSNNECDEGQKTIDGSSSGSCTPENDGNSSPKTSCEQRDQETFN